MLYFESFSYWDYIQLAIIAVLLYCIGILLKQIFTPPKPIIVNPAPPKPPPVKRAWTRAELRAYNGTDATKPILMAVNGTVYDVSRGRQFYGPGGPYGLFAGRDASRALAKSSFEAVYLDDPCVDNLTADEKTTLTEWAGSYEHKYINMGWLEDSAPKEQLKPISA